MSTQQAQAIAAKIFANHDINELFVTSDGQVFTSNGAAELHAIRTVKDKLVIPVKKSDLPIEAPKAPAAPETPDAPVTPVTPATPVIPEAPKAPVTPETPVVPVTPVTATVEPDKGTAAKTGN